MKHQESVANRFVKNINNALGAIPRALNLEVDMPSVRAKKRTTKGKRGTRKTAAGRSRSKTAGAAATRKTGMGAKRRRRSTVKGKRANVVSIKRAARTAGNRVKRSARVLAGRPASQRKTARAA